MSSVILSRHGEVAAIELNRADAANAIDHDLAARLAGIARQVAEEGWARAVLLKASGKLFCAGGDLSAILRSKAESSRDADEAFFSSLVQGFHDAIRALRAIDAPLIAAVQGTAAGGGMSLALACDIVLAAPEARFAPAYPGIGLVTDGGLSWSLARAVGERAALRILIENRPIDAAQAKDLGIIDLVLPAEDFQRHAMEQAQRIARLPRRVIVGVREMIDSSRSKTFEEQLELEHRTITDFYRADDATEGMKAFAERRPPIFTD